jgi:Flp pilus assembly protein CpaB
MHAKVILLIATGIVLVVASAIGTLFFVQQAKQSVAAIQHQLAAYGDLVPVPVPVHKIERGQSAQTADFKTVDMPRKFLPKGVLDYLPHLPKTVGAEYVALTDLEAGHILLPFDLGVAAGVGDAATMRMAGSNLTLVSPKNLNDISGQLKVGAYVDLFWQRDVGGGAKETRLLGRNLRITSFLRGAGEPKKWSTAEPASATALMLEAPPEIMARLMQAQASGSVYVAMASGLKRGASGEIVVGNSELRDLPLVTRAAPSGAGVTAPTQLERTLRQAVSSDGAETQLCSLSVVRQAVRSVIQVPCE